MLGTAATSASTVMIDLSVSVCPLNASGGAGKGTTTGAGDDFLLHAPHAAVGPC